MKELLIGNINNKALVDDEDFDRLSKFNWTARGKAKSCIGRVIHKKDKIPLFNEAGELFFTKTIKSVEYVSLSNEIFQTRGILYDHIDRNPLNNQKNNLRKASYSQNCQNRTKCPYTFFTGKGVRLKHGKWEASITFKRKNIYIGRFLTEQEALLAYNKAAEDLFKEFASINKT